MMRFSTFLRIVYERGNTAFLFLLVSLPTLAFPFFLVPIEMQKGIFAAILIGGGVFLYGLSLLFGWTTVKVPTNLSVSFLFALLLYLMVSGLIRTESAWQLFGHSFEIGTVGSFLLFSATFFIGSALTPQVIARGTYVWLAASAFAGCAALMAYAFMSTESFVTLVGEWPQLSFLMAAALLTSIVLFENVPERRIQYFLATAFFAALLVCFFHSAAAVALIVLLVAFIAYFSYRNRRLPLCASIAAFGIAIVLMVGVRTPLLQMPPDIRLSFFLNEMILAPAYISNTPQAMFGAGPGNFSELWEANRPYEFNQTPLWDRAFPEGYSTLGTIFVELGFVGALLFLLVPGAFIFYFFWEHKNLSAHSPGNGVYTALAFAILFLFVAAAIYTLHLLFFITIALALGASARLSTRGDIALSFRTLKAGRFFLGGAALLVGVFLIWIAGLQFLAARDYVQALAASEEQNFTEAAEKFMHAASLWPAPLYHRDASRALLEEAASSYPPESAEFKTLAAQAVTHADNAALYGLKDYWNWISKASIYVSLYSFGFVELEEETEIALGQARSLSPSRPEPLYLSSVFAFARGDRAEAVEYIDHALLLKPDYQDALAFKARMSDTIPQ